MYAFDKVKSLIQMLLHCERFNVAAGIELRLRRELA